jgi:hypothetical protein
VSPNQSKGEVPEEAVLAAARKAFRSDTGAKNDAPLTKDEIDSMRDPLTAALPAIEKHFADRLKEVERQRDEADAEVAKLRERIPEAEQEAENRLYVFFDDQEYPEARLRSQLAFVTNRAKKAEAALAERDQQVRAEVERLRSVEADCTSEVKRRLSEALPRNLIAEGRAGAVKAAANRLDEILTQPSSTPLQQDPEVGEMLYAAEQLCVQLSPVKTARTEKNIDTAKEMAERLRVELRRLTQPRSSAQCSACGEDLPAAGRFYCRATGQVAEAALPQPEADPEVPRWGRADHFEEALERIARGEVDRVEFADDDLISRFAQDALDSAPDCQPTPELLGEEVVGKLQAGYSLCHPEDDCAGQRAWLKAAGERDHLLDVLESIQGDCYLWQSVGDAWRSAEALIEDVRKQARAPLALRKGGPNA